MLSGSTFHLWPIATLCCNELGTRALGFGLKWYLFALAVTGLPLAKKFRNRPDSALNLHLREIGQEPADIVQDCKPHAQGGVLI